MDTKYKSVTLSEETYQVMAKLFNAKIGIENNDSLAEDAGKAIAEKLNLEKDKDGFFKTESGRKSAVGLARVVLREIFG